MTENHTNNRMQKKHNDFGLKYGNQKQKKKAEWINYMTRELGLENVRKRKYTSIHLKPH